MLLCGPTMKNGGGSAVWGGHPWHWAEHVVMLQGCLKMKRTFQLNSDSFSTTKAELLTIECSVITPPCWVYL